MAGLDIQLIRTTTAQSLAEALSDRILEGKFAPGERLRESAIASDLGVSRNTVREAVRVLELGGLVRYEVNKGAVVISPTPDTVRHLYVARARLEVAAARYRSESTNSLDGPRSAFAGLEAAAKTQDVHSIVTADLAFHSAVVGLLGSARLDDYYRDLTRELRFYLTVLSMEDKEFDRPESIVAEHAEIMVALESGDEEIAARTIEEHIHRNADRVCEIISIRETQGK